MNAPQKPIIQNGAGGASGSEGASTGPVEGGAGGSAHAEPKPLGIIALEAMHAAREGVPDGTRLIVFAIGPDGTYRFVADPMNVNVLVGVLTRAAITSDRLAGQ